MKECIGESRKTTSGPGHVACNLDDEKSASPSLETELVDDDGPQIPTEEELGKLPRVADELP